MQPGMKNPVKILLIEDNLGDIRLIEEVFKDAQIDNQMQVALDGEMAMEMLRKEGEHSLTTRPDLILLDLNLPKKDGREVLKEIKADKSLKCIPVLVLTTSTAEDDLVEAYQNNANCYITKPFDLNHFIRVVGIIEDFWLNIVKFPPKINEI
jgi:CheY-like chemotaxis protein